MREEDADHIRDVVLDPIGDEGWRVRDADADEADATAILGFVSPGEEGFTAHRAGELDGDVVCDTLEHARDLYLGDGPRD